MIRYTNIFLGYVNMSSDHLGLKSSKKWSKAYRFIGNDYSSLWKDAM